MSNYSEITGPAERTPEQARLQAEADSAKRLEMLAARNVEDAENGLALARARIRARHRKPPRRLPRRLRSRLA